MRRNIQELSSSQSAILDDVRTWWSVEQTIECQWYATVIQNNGPMFVMFVTPRTWCVWLFVTVHTYPANDASVTQVPVNHISNVSHDYMYMYCVWQHGHRDHTSLPIWSCILNILILTTVADNLFTTQRTRNTVHPNKYAYDSCFALLCF